MIGTEMARAHSIGGERSPEPQHTPVLAAEVVEQFRALSQRFSGDWIVDGTVGLGGHAALILEACPSLNVLGVDQDPSALEHAKRRLEGFGRRIRVRRGRLSELSRLIRKEQIGMPVGFLMDVGVSSLQIASSERGFSFQSDGPLDMRMDPTRDRTAADIVNHWDEPDLADLLFHEGGEVHARRVAHAIVEGRRRTPFLRTGALAETIARALGRSAQGGKIHPATKTFQALRRAVNEEGEELQAGLECAEHWLADGGRLVVIAFHSGEDREVKRFLQDSARAGRWKLLTKKPLAAGQAERKSNPRSRSAHLRCAERVRASANGAEAVLDEGRVDA